MRVKLLLMFKDEGGLLKSWIKYHASLVGKQNLVIFDNGSTCDETRRVVEWAKANSIWIDRSRDSRNDFVTRGDLFRDIINEKTYRFRADFYIPLDCDEFLAIDRDGRLDISRSALESELRKYKGTTRALAIHSGLDNDPTRPGRFVRSPDQRKTLFSAGNCLWLDEGFHYGLGMNGDEPIRTKIVYIHYHFKPYRMVVQGAKEKLAPYISEFSVASLKEHISKQGPAFHCAYHLLRTEDEYYDQFRSAPAVAFPEVEAAFRRVGEPLPFDTRAKVAAGAPLLDLFGRLRRTVSARRAI